MQRKKQTKIFLCVVGCRRGKTETLTHMRLQVESHLSNYSNWILLVFTKGDGGIILLLNHSVEVGVRI